MWILNGLGLVAYGSNGCIGKGREGIRKREEEGISKHPVLDTTIGPTLRINIEHAFNVQSDLNDSSDGQLTKMF